MVKKSKKIEHISVKAMENFKLYAQGVKRLKHLEEELNNLDTSKFKHEEKKIRNKLNNVSLIPEIEEDIRKLKLEIAGVDVGDLKSKVDKNQDLRLRQLSKKEKELKENHEKKLRILAYQEREIENQISKIPLVRKKINFLKDEQDKVIHYRIPHLREKVKLLERELEAAEALLFSKKSQLSNKDLHNIHNIPALMKIISLLSKKLRALYRESEILESQVKRSIQLTSAEKKDVGKIPLLMKRLGNLKNLFVKNTIAIEETVPNLVQRMGLIERAIVKAEQIARKKQLDKKEIHDVDKIPYLKKSLDIIKEEIDKADESIGSLRNNLNMVSYQDRKTLSKIGYLRHKLNEVEKLVEKEAEKIPVLEHRSLYLGRKVREEEKEIKDIEQKVDQNRLKFHEEMVNEIVESRRMLEEGKQEIRQQLLDLLAEAITRLDQKNAEKDKKILNEIERLKEELQKSKEEVHEKVSSRLSNIDLKIHKDENEFDKKILGEINLLKQEIEKNKNSFNQKISYKIHDLDEKINLDKKELEREIKNEEKLGSPELTSKGVQLNSKVQVTPRVFSRDEFFDSSFNNLVSKREPVFLKRIKEMEHSMKAISLKKSDLQKVDSRVIEEREPLSRHIRVDFADIKKEVEDDGVNTFVKPRVSDSLTPNKFHLPNSINILEENKIKEKPRKIKIPKKVFFDYDHFAEMANEINQLKTLLSGESHEIIENIAEKRNDFDLEVEKIMNNINKTRENLKKMNSNFSWKIK